MELGNQILSGPDVADLSWAVQGSEIEVAVETIDLTEFGSAPGYPVLRTIARNPGVFSTSPTRFFYAQLEDGEPSLAVLNFKAILHPHLRGRGLALLCLAKQVRCALRLGIGSLTVIAAGDWTKAGQLDGYSAWPAMGFGGTIPAHIWEAIPDDILLDAGFRGDDPPPDVRELCAGATGKEAWRAYGAGFTMEFELSDANPHVTRQLQLLEDVGL